MQSFTNQLYDLEKEENIMAILVQIDGNVQQKGGFYGFDYKNFSQNYLKDLFAFTYMLGQIETPLMPLVNGNWNGYGNVLPLLSTFPAFTQYGNIKFNDQEFGLPPLFMAHQLAKLDGNLGMYLALTGESLNGTDKAYLQYRQDEKHDFSITDSTKYWNKILEFDSKSDNQKVWEQYKSQIQTFLLPISSSLKNGDQWEKALKRYKKLVKAKKLSRVHEFQNRTGTDEYFAMKPENAKKVIMDILDKEQRSKKIEEQLEVVQEVQNNLLDFREKMKACEWYNFKDFEVENNQNYQSKLPLSTINRCFQALTYDEIIENLKAESSAWSQKTLQNLQSKDQLIQRIIFKMIKDGVKQEFYESLITSLRIGDRRLKDKDFQEFISTQDKTKIQKRTSVSNDQVLEYFQSTQLEQLFENLSTENELLPVKDFYQDIPESVRFFLNEYSSDWSYYAEDFWLNVKSWFKNVDVVKPGLCIESLRKHIYEQDQIKKEQKDLSLQLKKLSCDQAWKSRFYAQREEQIVKLFQKDPKKFIDQTISQYFQDSFVNMTQTITQRYDEMHSYQKYLFMKDIYHLMCKTRLRTSYKDLLDFGEPASNFKSPSSNQPTYTSFKDPDDLFSTKPFNLENFDEKEFLKRMEVLSKGLYLYSEKQEIRVPYKKRYEQVSDKRVQQYNEKLNQQLNQLQEESLNYTQASTSSETQQEQKDESKTNQNQLEILNIKTPRQILEDEKKF